MKSSSQMAGRRSPDPADWAEDQADGSAQGRQLTPDRFPLSPTTVRALHKAGIRTREQLARMTREELLALDRIGAKSFGEVERYLAQETAGAGPSTNTPS